MPCARKSPQTLCSRLAGYGLNQPTSPSSRIQILPGMPISSAPTNPSPFARSRVHVDPSVIRSPWQGRGRSPSRWRRLGPRSASRTRRAVTSRSSPSATNSVAGSELLLSTVTFQDRAFGGTGPTAGGSGVGSGVGLGKTGGGGLGKAGNGGIGTPAGTYSSAAPLETHSRSSLQSLPPATRTVPSSRSVNEEPVVAPEHARGGRQRPGPRVVQRRGQAPACRADRR